MDIYSITRGTEGAVSAEYVEQMTISRVRWWQEKIVEQQKLERQEIAKARRR